MTAFAIQVDPPRRPPRISGLVSRFLIEDGGERTFVQDTSGGGSPWEMTGTRFLPELACDPTPRLYGTLCSTSPLKDVGDEFPDEVETCPFVVWTRFTCRNTGIDLMQRAIDQLLYVEGQGVEDALWNGVADLDNLPDGKLDCFYLTNGDVQVLSDSAHGDFGAMGLMVQALAQLGGSVIHLPYVLMPAILAHTLAKVQPDGRITTLDGEYELIFGRGYSGTGPDGVEPSAGETWIYGTGPIQIRRSGLFVPGDQTTWLDRSNNRFTVFAERSYVIEVDPCPTVALRVTIPEGADG